MNTLDILLISTFVAVLIILAMEFWVTKTTEREYSPPRFVDCGLGVRSDNKVYFKGLWISPPFITPVNYNGNFQFLLAGSIIFHAVRGDNRDGEGWHIYQVEYATAFELIKEANRIIDSSKQQSNERQ